VETEVTLETSEIYLEVRHPRCVGSITNSFVYYMYSRTHLYLPSSTVRIHLSVSALYVGHLQVEIKLTDQLYNMCGCLSGNWVEGGGVGGTRSRCFNRGYHDLGLLQSPPNSQTNTHTSCIADL